MRAGGYSTSPNIRLCSVRYEIDLRRSEGPTQPEDSAITSLANKVQPFVVPATNYSESSQEYQIALRRRGRNQEPIAGKGVSWARAGASQSPREEEATLIRGFRMSGQSFLGTML